MHPVPVTSIRIVPIRSAFLQGARGGIDDLGQPVERIVDARLSSPQPAATDLDTFFARADVAFVLARFPTYGCHALRLELA
jgi:hypothetical protein